MIYNFDTPYSHTNRPHVIIETKKEKRRFSFSYLGIGRYCKNIQNVLNYIFFFFDVTLIKYYIFSFILNDAIVNVRY